MRTLVLFSTSSTYRPRSVVASLAADQAALGSQVTVLDVIEFSYVTQDLPPRWFARLCGQDVYPNALEEVLAVEGVVYKKLPRSPLVKGKPLPPLVAKEFNDAVFSELITYLLTDTPDHNNWFTRYTENKLREISRPLYWELREFLSKNPFDQVFVPNGRVPDQRLALIACQEMGLPLKYYEIGRALENSYYTGDQQVHDREGTQAEVFEKTQDLSAEEMRSMARDWLTTRMTTGLAIHPFNKDWAPGKESQPDSGTAGLETAVFFSSSVDEFASYGGSWKSDSWDDQYQAFEAILGKLQTRAVRCILRVHPNLQNKSRSYVKREIRRIKELQARFPGTVVLSHTDATSSYDLVKSADYIFVGRSTLGLEASCLGKCVWTTTAARYDTIADVRQLLHPESITEDVLTPWAVDTAGAERFVAYWVTQDHTFRYGEHNWSTWDTLRSPLSMKIGNLFIKNSLPHKVHLIRLEINRWLNRRLGRRLSWPTA
jgi:hypothetical protein